MRSDVTMSVCDGVDVMAMMIEEVGVDVRGVKRMFIGEGVPKGR